MAFRTESSSILRAEVAKVLESEAFRNTPGLRTLFEYLANRTLDGNADELKEFTIGVEALGRPADYDPQLDPSVRVQVSRLRKRLDVYYLTEGSDDAVRIRVPKRQFGLEFAQVAPSERHDKHSAEATATRSPAPAPDRFWRIAAGALAAAVILLTAFIAANWTPGGASASNAVVESSAEAREFWATYAESDRPITLSLGVAMFLRVPNDNELDTTYLRRATLNEWPLPEDNPELTDLLAAIGNDSPAHPVYHFCGVGEAISSYLIGRSLASAGLNAPIVRSTFLSWDEVKENNLIFVGPPKFNRHIETGQFERNFRVVDGGIENLDPLPGEPEFFGKESVQGRPTIAHGLISRFRSGSGQGLVTIFSSNDGTGTWAAVEQLIRPDRARELLAKLRGEDGTLPENFEAVVRARCDMDYPVEVEAIAHRVY